MKVDRYFNDSGMVGVLVAGYPSGGWSTNANDGCLREFLLMDKTLVKMCVDGNWSDDAYRHVGSVFGDLFDSNSFDWSGVSVKFIEEGDRFVVVSTGDTEVLVNEYDLEFVS